MSELEKLRREQRLLRGWVEATPGASRSSRRRLSSLTAPREVLLVAVPRVEKDEKNTSL